MKKLILYTSAFVTLLFLTGKLIAALPLDNMSQNRTFYSLSTTTTTPSQMITYPANTGWNTMISSVSAPASGSAALIVLPVVQSTTPANMAVTSNSTYTARNCLTDVYATLSNGSTMYIIDGALTAATTSYTIYGAGIVGSSTTAVASTVSGVFSKHWDGIRPFCGTAGNALTISIPAPSSNTSFNAVSVEGYSVYTGVASNLNAGQ